MRLSPAAQCVVTLISWPILLTAEVRASDAEMAVCAATEDSVARLACFDGLASKRGATSPQIQLEERGDWNVRVETSKIDDRKNVFLTIESKDFFQDRFGRPKRGLMAIACRENSTDLLFAFEDMFMSDNSQFGDVTYRIDKQPAQSIKFTESTDNRALGLWHGKGIPMIRELFGSKNLLIRVTPFNESPITVEFNTTGLESAIAPLRKACSW